MIYYCADDYGLCDMSSERIKTCIDKGALNKVSVFLNFNTLDLNKISQGKKVDLSLHLNLVEGKCISDSSKVNLLTDKEGNFKHTFGGLFLCNLFNKSEFEAQVYREVRAQILLWRDFLPDNEELLIDSHQHTHMIPAVFKAVLRVLHEEKIRLKYLRIPAEPILPYIKTPSLYFTYNPVNMVKQWLLKYLWLIDKKYISGKKIPSAYFFGILFSGKMDEKRVKKVLPHYIKTADKKNMDIEVLFHPGYLNKDDVLEGGNIAFKKFYLSKNRRTEFNTLIKI